MAQTSPVRLHDLASKKISLADEFMMALSVAGVSANDLHRVLKISLDPAAIVVLLPGMSLPATDLPPLATESLPTTKMPAKPAQEYDPLNSNFIPGEQLPLTRPIITSRSLPAWRGAEQYVALALESYGYSTEDRSRQNLGYDLLATKATEKFYVEVKLLDYAGQPFTLTSNEEAVARECGNIYALALVLRSKDGTHLQFIRNPVISLRFVRQCRQWVWECSEYEFQSQVFQGDI